MARLIQVIESTEGTRGNGTDASPVRTVLRYFAPDGELLASVDEWWRDELRLTASRHDPENPSITLKRLMYLILNESSL